MAGKFLFKFAYTIIYLIHSQLHLFINFKQVLFIFSNLSFQSSDASGNQEVSALRDLTADQIVEATICCVHLIIGARSGSKQRSSDNELPSSLPTVMAARFKLTSRLAAIIKVYSYL